MLAKVLTAYSGLLKPSHQRLSHNDLLTDKELVLPFIIIVLAVF